MKPAFRKLKSTNGETLVETLVATLVVSLAMIAFSMMLSSTVNIITVSRDTINRYINSEGSIPKDGPDGPDGPDGTVKIIRVDSNGKENEVKFTYGSDKSIEIKADLFEHGNRNIISYHKKQ